MTMMAMMMMIAWYWFIFQGNLIQLCGSREAGRNRSQGRESPNSEETKQPGVRQRRDADQIYLGTNVPLKIISLHHVTFWKRITSTAIIVDVAPLLYPYQPTSAKN